MLSEIPVEEEEEEEAGYGVRLWPSLGWGRGWVSEGWRVPALARYPALESEVIEG